MWRKLHNKKTITLSMMFTLLALSSIALSYAYEASTVVTNFTMNKFGSFTKTEPNAGVTYDITGKPGSSGSVVAKVENGNPFPNALIPSERALSKFITISFNYPAQDFIQTTITFSYTDFDVLGIKEPYAIYKYSPQANVFVEFGSIVDPVSQTITMTLENTDDPTFAIGGSSITKPPGDSSPIWIALAVVITIIIVGVFLIVRKTIQ